MSKPTWMPFYYHDFRQDTVDLTPEEKWVYLELICLAWHRGDGSIPDNMDWLKTYLQTQIINFHGLTFNRIVPKLLAQFFTRKGDKFYQKRTGQECVLAREISENGRRNAEERWARMRKNNGLGDGPPMPLHYKERKIDSSFLTSSETDPREEEKKRVADEGSKQAVVQAGPSLTVVPPLTASEELQQIIREKGWGKEVAAKPGVERLMEELLMRKRNGTTEKWQPMTLDELRAHYGTRKDQS